ncbi:lipopolysaccharide core biosynthesis glycosyltransferase KdtX [Geobacter sp. OR-1]|uniref:glycosyltransferase family 2 protein n=1 Tax=Geobacter sp. OR-1 TaxID=1266765 RepID=UPI000542BB19|nr:glycosyltransferase family 2 protein [Geobacter sp. OR-1]GAM07928.1 lipopolysaccharide core biosynthesis glycosyltransferase KdtX [Geobacter sp. OR-1]
MADKISCIVIARDEEARIGDCLDSVRWADEIVVVDSGSSDNTVAIAKGFTDRVHVIPWQGFGPQKQAAVELAAHDLIFSIDCDERVTPELAAELRELAEAGDRLPGYTVPRRTFVGKNEIRHCGWYPDRTIRLFDRRRARFSDSPVHERVIVSGTVGDCCHHLLHYSFAGFRDMLAKMNHYTDLAAEQMHAAGRFAGYADITVRPLYMFIRTYLFQLGFLDGFAGYLVSVSNAVSVFAKYAKLMERNRK